MFAARRSLTALALAGAIAGAAPAMASDEPIATANPAPAAANTAQPPATPAAAAPDPGVAAQIDQYLKTSPALVLPKDGANGITSGVEEPRRVHGVVDVAVGNHGYRSAYVQSDFPVGKTGTLSVAVQETQGRFPGYGYGYGPYGGPGAARNQNVALGLSYGGATQDGRCRAPLAGRHRIDPAFMGPGGFGPGGAPICDRSQPAPERPLD